MHKSEEIIDTVEGKFELDEEICCALDRGFEQNPGVVKQLLEVVSDESMKFYTDILANATEMKFVPTEEIKMVYSQIAKRELERIAEEGEGDEALTCGHSIEEHQLALMEALEKMEPTVN